MKGNAFGERVAQLRREKHLSQYQLGMLIGVTDKAVSKWENGSAFPGVAHCIRLAEVLDVSLDELIQHRSGNIEND